MAKPDALWVFKLPDCHSGSSDRKFFRAEKSGIQIQCSVCVSRSEYVLFAVVLVIVSAALPAYSQQLFIQIGIPAGFAPTLANVVNILVQVVLSYPAMKFWIMPKGKAA